MLHSLKSLALFVATGCAMLTVSGCDQSKVEESPKKPDSVAIMSPGATPGAQGPVAPTAIPEAPVDTSTPSGKMPPPAASLASDVQPNRTPDGKVARYGLKSAKLVFKYGGDLRGERVVIFDDYGMKERTEDRFTPFPAGSAGPGPTLTSDCHAR